MNLPQQFTEYTRQLMGDDLFSVFSRGLDEEPPVSVRLNPFKAHPTLQGAEAVPWAPLGFYLKKRAAFTFDPLLHAGLYYVQEASSMFVCEVMRQLKQQQLLSSGPLTMLDLCAAPGGKSTALRSVLPEGSLLFSNEPVKTRASILKENIIKFGHPDVIVTNNYPRDFRKAKITFDAVLTDVPCSGEGMFRKDPNAINEWSVANVEKCRQLQRSIIEDIWPCLKPGGILIYSTCTLNAHEDEENADWIAKTLGADFIEIDTKTEWNITGALTGDNPCYRFVPGKTRGEGLFVAVLRKHGNGNGISNDECESSRKSNKKRKNSKEDKNSTVSDRGWLKGDFTEYQEGDFIRAIPTRWSPIYNNVKSKLHVIHAGVGIGTMKGKDIIPDPSLVLSTAFDMSAFPHADLGYADAIRFLRKEAVALPTDMPRGFTTITYHGQPLGIEKNIGNRANNIYPQEWKIKSSHIPESASSLPCRPIER